MKIRVYATLRDLLGVSAVELPVAGPSTVGEMLRRLVEAHPALGEKLWHPDGSLTGLVTILSNGRSIEYLQGLATPLDDTHVLSLFPPVGGGAAWPPPHTRNTSAATHRSPS
jgi:molybdopterin synthase sulfur carrier subunit